VLAKVIGLTGNFNILSYVYKDSEFYICKTKLPGFEGLQLYFSTNYENSVIYLYLSDSEVNNAAHLLSALAFQAKSGKAFDTEQVISTDDQYLNGKGFSGLLFLCPEDIEIYADLTMSEEIDQHHVKCLCIIPLTHSELSSYERKGFDAVIETFDREERDFFSVEC